RRTIPISCGRSRKKVSPSSWTLRGMRRSSSRRSRWTTSNARHACDCLPALLDYFLLAEPTDQDVEKKADVAAEREASDAEILARPLIRGGVVGHCQRVDMLGLDFAVADDARGQIATLEFAEDDAIVERHDVPDVALQ